MDASTESSSVADEMLSSITKSLESTISTGPLCDEPMRGLAFVIEQFFSQQYGMKITGQVVTHVEEDCRAR